MKDMKLEAEQLETLDTPGIGEWLAGLGAGLGLGGIALGIGLAIT